MKIPTYNDIKPYIEKGLITEQVHPENGDVRIYNYSQQTQFSKAWDDITQQCRGLILNIVTGDVLARPFPKFFNFSEHVQNAWPIPNDTPVVMEKMDGSLGILYSLNGKAWIATRGSFVSDQAQWATKWFRSYFQDHAVNPGQTALFEILYPENRIVVKYDYSGLVHLATLDIETGEVIEDTWNKHVRKPKQIPITDIAELMKLDEPNSEGFVIFYPKENIRMKIKFPEYVRLHKIITGVSEIGIWEIMKDGGNLGPLMEKVPDEFFNWVTRTVARLRAEHAMIKMKAVEEYETLRGRYSPSNLRQWPRREVAEAISKMARPGLGFSLLDEKPIDDAIWKMVRPHGKHIFKTDIDM